MRLLARRAHSESELRLKLGRRRVPRAEIDAALARLRRLGYLDDGAFARALVAHRSSTRGRSAMAAELRERGVDRQLAEAALGEVDLETEVQAALKLARRFGPLPPRLTAARLQRRGFRYDVIREAIRRLGDRPRV